jgi:two-component system response regulator PilR (NtrC family)
VVSATHKDLGAEVAAGRFRQDLFYRLNVIDIDIPPLRERPEDLPALCEALLARIAKESGTPPRQIATTTIARLASLPLLGNVRELENILHRALALSDDPVLELSEVGPAGLPSSPERGDASPAIAETTPLAKQALPEDLQGYLDEKERQILVRALRETGFNRTLAAKLLGLTLRQIRYRIARLKIDAPEIHVEDGVD